MKRSRADPGSDEEPLAKKINNLHIDNPILASANSSSSSESNESFPMNHDANFFPRSSMYQQMPNTSAASVISNHNETNNNSMNMGAKFPPHGNNTYQHSHMVNQMIANRELPESLNEQYPVQDPSMNSHYYHVNRTLHDLHFERLRRSGKLS